MSKRWGALIALAVTLAACGGQGARQPTPPAGPPVASAPVAGLLFTSDRDGNAELYRMMATGEGLTRLTENPATDASGAWSPDGRQIAFRSTRDGSSDLFLMGANGEHPTNLLFDPPDSALDDFRPRYRPDGRALLFYSDRLPRDGACDGHHMATLPLPDGGSEQVAPVSYRDGSQESYAWSPDGRQLIYSQRGCTGAPRLYLRPESGQSEAITPADVAATAPAWSPDGTRVAFQMTRDGNTEIVVLELATATLTTLTDHPATDSHPTWSPDGRQIAFVSTRDGNAEIYVMGADGADPHNITQHPARDDGPAWSPIP